MRELRYFSSKITHQERNVKGRASVFGIESRDYGGFIEIVHKGFFDDVMDQDTVALWEHDMKYPLARVKNKSLVLDLSDTGLNYSFSAPLTTYANDLLINLDSGLVDESSFGLIIAEDGEDIERRSDGRWIRHLHKAAKLIDVSPVTLAAFPNTDVAKRSIDGYLKALDQKANKTFLHMADLTVRLQEIENCK